MQPNALLLRQNFDSQKVSVTRQLFPSPHRLPSPPSPLQPYKRCHHLGHFPHIVLQNLAPLIRAPSRPTPSIDVVFHSSPPPVQPHHRAARFWPRWAPRCRPLPPVLPQWALVPRGTARRALVELGAPSPPWTMAPPGLPTRGLGPLSFLLKNISFLLYSEKFTLRPPCFVQITT
jgi:hypothetical protein